MRTHALLLSAVVAMVCLMPATGQNTAVYKDPDAPLDKRVADLVSRMTLEEKVSQMLSASPAIERLGVPAYDWWNECLHGVARAGVATVFPEPIGMAASFDENLMFKVATAISDEARAKHNEFLRHGHRGIYEGLTFWTPNINLFRDPRWGRGMETYGEDPYLTGRLAVQFVRGLQGDDPHYLKTVSTAKHYAVHSGPESSRHEFNVNIDEHELRNTYLPQFEAAIRDGGARSVMCAYNAVRGEPACSSTMLLDQILRNQWQFTGYVVSDCGAISDIYRGHKAQPNAEAGAAAAVKAGTDLDCGLEYEHLVPAVKQGLLPEKDIDTAVRRLFTARFKLGMFDPPERVPYAKIPYSVNDSPQHGALALEMARESIVLLKNEGNLLPLDRKKLKTVAVIGPNAESLDVLLGNYNGEPSHPVTPLDGIRQKLGGGVKVLFAQGSQVAAGVPVFETVPSSALFTATGSNATNGLNAEYFGTAAFNGRNYFGKAFVSATDRKAAPAPPSNPKPVFTRVDPNVNFDWGLGAPRNDMDSDNFGVRWTGYLKPTVSGSYQLGATGMNAFELYLDDKLLFQFSNPHEKSYIFKKVDLEAGKLYSIRLDYHEVINSANIRLIWSPPEPNYQEEALATAKQADVAILCLGLSPRIEGEEMPVNIEGFKGGDRMTLDIPAVQQQLLEKVVALGKPVVLVLLNGSAVSVGWARDHVPAIVELWYPGQAGGTALADVLFGDYNPAGRLPVTFYKSVDQLPPFDNYSMENRTYRYFEGEPLYPFGYGLSYTTFAYANLQLPTHAEAGGDINFSVDVKNTGAREGDEAIQVYVRHPGAPAPAPIRELKGFRRVHLKPGEAQKVEFTLTPRELSIVRRDGQRAVEPGVVEIAVGGKQPGFQGPADAVTTSVITGRIELTGTAKMLP
jgi:beta-glucosidase